MARRPGMSTLMLDRPSLFSRMRQPAARPTGQVGVSGIRRFSGALYLLPSLSLLVAFVLVPIVMSFWLSFTTYSVLEDGEWVGAANYLRLLEDPAFHAALWHTVVYTAIAVPLQTLLSLALAAILAARFRNRFGGLVRSVLFVPVLSSLVVIGVVWRILLGTDEGAINRFIGFFGLPPVNWLGSPELALVVIALVAVWQNVGYFLVIYYAGILAIPSDLYEAASIDGARGRQQFLYITIPSLKPVTLLVVILGTIWSFQVFDLIYVMTGGGPGGATTTIVMGIYRAGFQNFQMGYASAMAMVLFAIVLVISFIQWRLRGEEK
ncbi:carbohydrate ABC transporter permease [Agromyces aerolatus]|uniref:carbohydrate ABC transporter permease n=1 Tax=Agromyces sp. LY-1074 TaxID=3074080 RepID=UPI0028580A6F|nr:MULTISPECIES: sugar ABC transporter permease [unclassified Agromyces]MDR5700480.1 sugar ABC transporter permease [Agromyces sp. LY-1074]MDR5707001.1 sugar ABC transporter permease [Agromyces sp. LY-1358]